MTGRDQWTETLRCPNCGMSGTVVLSQARPDSQAYHDGTDQNVRPELVPPGFRSAAHEFGCDFYCAKCGSLAHHA